MPRPKATCEASVFERTRDLVVGIAASGIMSDPRTIRMDVGSFRMAGPIGKGPAFWHVWLDSGRLAHWSGRRTTSRNMSTANLTMFATLCKSRDKGYGQHCEKPNRLLHDRCLQFFLKQLEVHLLPIFYQRNFLYPLSSPSFDTTMMLFAASERVCFDLSSLHFARL
jgi:hypothetical protein